MNLITNDVGRLDYVTLFLGYLVIGPIQGLFVIVVLVRVVDPYFLTGLGVMCILVPAQSFIGKIYDRLR